jgi:EAL domain-containing protein (putative c-di-GMP-specific phosphodiesterase class I)
VAPPATGPVGTGEFLPIVESTELMDPDVGGADQALATRAGWLHSGLELKVAVNISHAPSDGRWSSGSSKAHRHGVPPTLSNSN